MAKRLTNAEAEQRLRARGYTPRKPYPGSTTKSWLMICPEGHDCAPTLGNVHRGTGGCQRCGRAKAAAALRISAEEAEIRLRARGYTPRVPYPGVDKPWDAVCPKGHECSPSLSNLQQGHGGCQTCGNVMRAAARRLSNEDADAVFLAAGCIPQEPYGGALTPRRCICMTCGDDCAPRLGCLQQGQGGCKKCGYVKAAATNRLSDEDADAVFLAARCIPYDPYEGALTPRRCICWEGHECAPRLNDLQQGHGGCQTCSNGGFDRSKPASLYLISGVLRDKEIDGVRHRELPVTKLGIANVLDRRLAQHSWHDTLLDVMTSPDGVKVELWERQLKELLNLTDIVTFSADTGRVSKRAETWETDCLPVTSLQDLKRDLEAMTGLELVWSPLVSRLAASAA